MQAIGAAGELIVQARLLVRGWTAGNVNSGGMMNAPAIDLLAARGPQTIRVAVKTTGHGGQNAQWSVIQNWTTLFKGGARPDFVIFVWFTDRKAPDACRIFVVPADVVDADVLECHRHWHKFPRRDGVPQKIRSTPAFLGPAALRKETSRVALPRSGQCMKRRGTCWSAEGASLNS